MWRMRRRSGSGENVLLHHNFALPVQFALVPVRAVGEMVLASGRVNRKVGSHRFVMGSALIASGLGCFAFRIWHGITYLIFFNASHRGSAIGPESVEELYTNPSASGEASCSRGCSLFIGTERAMNS